MVRYHNILVTLARPVRKLASVVGVHTADMLDIDIKFICRCNLERLVVLWAWQLRRLAWETTGSSIGGLKALVCLYHVALECLIGY